jgi:hypothetical protein
LTQDFWFGGGGEEDEEEENKGCVTLAIYIKKYLKAKEDFFLETRIFHHAKI